MQKANQKFSGWLFLVLWSKRARKLNTFWDTLM